MEFPKNWVDADGVIDFEKVPTDEFVKYMRRLEHHVLNKAIINVLARYPMLIMLWIHKIITKLCKPHWSIFLLTFKVKDDQERTRLIKQIENWKIGDSLPEIVKLTGYKLPEVKP